MQALEPGQDLGAYRIIRLLGEGGMGCVYEAEHVGLRVRRALKVFSSGSKHSDLLRRRFVAEGRILADLRHPRIVRVYDFAIDRATSMPYFAMDLVVSPSGAPLTLEGACRAGVTEDQVAGWFGDICEGLGYIHSKGIVHRDVSLDNVLVGADGHAVIGDFGIAKIVGEDYRRKIDVTVTMPLPPGEALRWGKGLYQAPELKRGEAATPASDAYAVGVLLFRLLVGSWYTPETKLEDMLAGMDYNWSEVIGRLCAPDPRGRLPTGGVSAAPEGLRQLRPASFFRPSFARASVAVLALAALSSAAWWAWPKAGRRDVAAKVPPIEQIDPDGRRKDGKLNTAQSNELARLKKDIISKQDAKERK